jgi:hypothetical protein
MEIHHRAKDLRYVWYTATADSEPNESFVLDFKTLRVKIRCDVDHANIYLVAETRGIPFCAQALANVDGNNQVLNWTIMTAKRNDDSEIVISRGTMRIVKALMQFAIDDINAGKFDEQFAAAKAKYAVVEDEQAPESKVISKDGVPTFTGQYGLASGN